MELIGRQVKQNGAEIAVEGSRVVAFKTDATNGYLSRPDNRGRVITIGGLSGKCSFSSALRDGRLTTTFTALPGMVSPGDEIVFTVGLLDEAMPEPVTEELRLRVIPSRKPPPPGGRSRQNGRDSEKEGDDEITEGRALPSTGWLTRDGRPIGQEETEAWPDGFTEQDGGEVRDFGDDKVYKVNYDNAHFRRFLDRERNDIDKKVVTEQYRVGMLVLMMGLDDAYSRMEQSETKTQLEECIDEIRRLAAKGASTVVMSIAKNLPTIVNPGAVADPDDD